MENPETAKDSHRGLSLRNMSRQSARGRMVDKPPCSGRIYAPPPGGRRVKKRGEGGRQPSISLNCEPNFTPATSQAVWMRLRIVGVLRLCPSHQPFPRLLDAFCANSGLA